MLKNIFIMFIPILIIIGLIAAFIYFYIMPKKFYYNKDFNIKTYISNIDMDNDGIDDQTDILKNVKNYIKKKPKYKSKYYITGYSNDNYGVCTDVVAIGLYGAGYDLRELVNKDIIENKYNYNINNIDKNIDFRRVRNLSIYFKNNSINLTTDLSNIKEWQGGDIVIFKDHIGIISDKRNKKGIPYLIHHANEFQTEYEEDTLEYYESNNDTKIIGHYRIS